MHQTYRWFWLSAAIIAIDQLTKIIADRLLSFGEPEPLLPLLNAALAYNRGAAFSFLSDASGWQRWFFIVLSLVVSIILIVWIMRLSVREKWTAASLALILGGAIGNLIDRIIYGHVVDFIDFYYPAGKSCLPLFAMYAGQTCHWPTFNVADSAISIGAVILLATSLFSQEQPK